MKIIDQCYENYPWGKIVPTLPMQLLIISYCFKPWNSNSKDSFVSEKIPELQHPLTSKPRRCKGYFLWGDAAQWLLEKMAILIQNNALYYLSKYSLRSITRNSSFSFRVWELSGIYKTEGMCAIQLVTLLIQWATLSEYTNIWLQRPAKTSHSFRSVNSASLLKLLYQNV